MTVPIGLDAKRAFLRAVAAGEAEWRMDVRDAAGRELGWMEPITRRRAGDPMLVADLTRWRNAARGAFLTQFTATPARTRRWLEEVVLRDDRRLLFVIGTGDQRQGLLGFTGLTDEEAELDNLMRREEGVASRLIFEAERALILALFERLRVRRVTAVVLASNFPALALQKAMGFGVRERFPLSRVDREGEVHLIPGAPGTPSPDGLYAYRLEIDRERLEAAE